MAGCDNDNGGHDGEATALYEALELGPLIEEALRECETVKCGCNG